MNDLQDTFVNQMTNVASLKFNTEHRLAEPLHDRAGPFEALALRTFVAAMALLAGGCSGGGGAVTDDAFLASRGDDRHGS